MVLYSVVSVCVFVCLSVNTITPELLEVSSRNFQDITIWSKGQASSKVAILRCAGEERTSRVSGVLVSTLMPDPRQVNFARKDVTEIEEPAVSLRIQ